jgi:hypothetical protein
MQYFVLDRRVRLEAAGPPGDLLIPPPPYWFGAKSKLVALPIPREYPARLTIPADVPPGPIHFQAANANGGSAVGVFIVSPENEILEEESRKGPQVLPALPVNVSGRLLKNEEVDRYRFATPKAGPVTCELQARQLGSKFHGILAVHETDGRLVADIADTEGTDVALTFPARAGAEYVVSVRDVDFAGDRSFCVQDRAWSPLCPPWANAAKRGRSSSSATALPPVQPSSNRSRAPSLSRPMPRLRHLPIAWRHRLALRRFRCS